MSLRWFGSSNSAPSSSAPLLASPKVGVVAHVYSRCLRNILLIRRAHEPAKGKISLPGGRLELGESLADAAVREVLEETGIRSRVVASDVPPFVTESVTRASEDGRIRYHYILCHVVAVAEPALGHLLSLPEPRAGDDAAEAFWRPVADAQAMDQDTVVDMTLAIRRSRHIVQSLQLPDAFVIQ